MDEKKAVELVPEEMEKAAGGIKPGEEKEMVCPNCGHRGYNVTNVRAANARYQRYTCPEAGIGSVKAGMRRTRA